MTDIPIRKGTSRRVEQRKIDDLLALMGIKRNDNADGLPVWHQPNPLPRGMH